VGSTGFLVVDSTLRPVYANPEAVKILGYPDNSPLSDLPDQILARKILSFLSHDSEGQQTSLVTHFQSGRRRYYCRTFVLEDHRNDNSGEQRIAMLLERERTCLPTGSGQQMYGRKGLENPFSFHPELKYYYPSRTQRDVFLSFHTLIRERCGIGILLGKAGMGKTSFLQYFSAKLRHESDVHIFSGKYDTGAAITKKVLSLLEILNPADNPDTNLRLYKSWLHSAHRAGRHITLVCDEAHYLSQDALLAICRMAKTGESTKRIHLVLSGHQGFWEKYKDLPVSIAFKERNTICRLLPMDEAEVSSYILHRLNIAGYSQPIFSSPAISAIATYSRGIPLYINMLCRTALVVAASNNIKLVDDRIISESAYDLVLSSNPFISKEQAERVNPGTKNPESDRRRRGLKLVNKQDSAFD